MKKFLSFLTLLLIALMLFVGCNNDIPTGEKPENGGTSIPSEEKPEEPGETPEEPGTTPENPGESGEPIEPEVQKREAKSSDALLVYDIINTISYLDYFKDSLPECINLSNGIYTFKPDSAFLVKNTGGYDVYNATFNGTTFMKQKINSEENKVEAILDFDLKEGTKFETTNEPVTSRPFTIELEGTVTAEMSGDKQPTYTFTKVVIDGSLVTGLDTLMNNASQTEEPGGSEVREATPEEKEIFNSLINASMYAIKNRSEGVEEVSYTTLSLTDVQVNDITLYGTAIWDESISLELTEGTAINAEAHKLYCEGILGEDGIITVNMVILDGNEITGFGTVALE